MSVPISVAHGKGVRLCCAVCAQPFDTPIALSHHGQRRHGTANVTIQPMCPYCGDLAAFMPDSSAIYRGQNYGAVWRCAACDAHVGCHRGTDRPLGRLADRPLRLAKQAAHEAFDPLWARMGMSRSDAYMRLADRLGIPVKQTHIGMFDHAMCERVIKAAAEIKAAILRARQGGT